MNKTLSLLIIVGTLSSCSKNKETYDASGTFEAVETIVSAEASGTIKALNLEEGQELTAGQTVGYIDSVQLYLRKKQLQAQAGAILSRKPNIGTQTAALQEQLRQAEREQRRVTNLMNYPEAEPRGIDGK